MTLTKLTAKSILAINLLLEISDVATFLQIDNAENRAIRKRQAFETVAALLDALGATKFV
jgi:hypothetical protein